MYGLLADRLRGLLEAKGLKRRHFLVQGFTESQFGEWVYRRRPTRVELKGSDAIKLAVWLEVPPEYLFGAPTEYDDLPFWEVATRASLDTFLRRTPKGRQARYLRQVFEAHLETYREHAPRSVELWSRFLDVVLLARRHHEEEARELDRLAGAQIPLQFEAARENWEAGPSARNRGGDVSSNALNRSQGAPR